MKQSEIYRENAENCAQLAEGATSEPVFNRYKRMEAAWRALANEQDWLDGEVSPSRIPIAWRQRPCAGKPGIVRFRRLMKVVR